MHGCGAVGFLMAGCLLLAPSPAACAADAAAGDIVIECGRLRAVLGPDAAWRSLMEKASGRELLAPGGRVAFAAATFEESVPAPGAGTDGNVHDQQRRIAEAAARRKAVPASRAALVGDRLTLGFAGADCEVAFRVVSGGEWIAFTVSSVAGRRPRELELVRVAVAPASRVGPRLAAGWDETMAAGLCAVNLQTQASARKKDGAAWIVASTQDAPGPRLEGAGAALLAAPPAEYRAILQRLAAAFDLPRNEGEGGVPAKDLPIARESYWFLRFGEAEVDSVVDCCRRSGFRQVLLNSGAWCASPGHYVFNTKLFPEGLESLRRTVARLHEAGLRVGMHCFASKVAKTDPYVTPVPDRRFWVDRSCTLAGDVGKEDTEIGTSDDLREWPGSPVASQTLWEGGVAKHREVILDDEIVQFTAIGPEGRWNTFLGCTRGAFATRPAAHKAGTPGRHYGVDGCINGYIIDQETDLLDEVATRLAGIFNACGFDLVYFDGGEDVDRRRFVHYVSKFQDAAMRKFARRPIVHMGTILTHNLWHSFARSGTVDTYLNTLHGHIQAGGSVETWPTVRQHIDTSVDYLLSLADDMMPGELGWFGIWPRGDKTDGLQLDETEYLMAKSLAYDAPVSLQTSFTSMAKHPFTPGILEIVKAYETLRMGGAVPAAVRAPLREKGRDFALVRLGGAPRFVRLDAPFAAAGGLRVSVGALDGGSAALLWGTEQAGTLRIPVARDALRAETIDGNAVDLGGGAEAAEARTGPRRIALGAPGLAPAALREALAKAVWRADPAGESR